MSEDKPKSTAIRLLEQQIDDLRREMNQKNSELKKTLGSTIVFIFYLIRSIINFMYSIAPKTKETAIADYRFARELYESLRELDINEEFKKEMITIITETAKNTLRASSPFIPFNAMIDVLMRGLGKDLIKKMIPPALIGELWGADALERFNRLLQD